MEDATIYYAATNNAGCLSGKSNPGRLAVSVYSVLSNPEFGVTDFKIYPNPIKDILNLSSSSREISSVSVQNLLGQTVISKTLNSTQSQLDLSGLSNGTYLVKVTIDNSIKTIKIVKE